MFLCSFGARAGFSSTAGAGLFLFLEAVMLPLPDPGEPPGTFVERFCADQGVRSLHPLLTDRLSLAHGLLRTGKQRYAWQKGEPVGQLKSGEPIYRWHDPETGETRKQGVEPGTGKKGKETEEPEKEDIEGDESEQEHEEWDGVIDENEVDRSRRADEVRTWNFYDDDGSLYEQAVVVREGTYDPFPDDPDSEPVDVYRWESDQYGQMTDHGEWTTEYREAVIDGANFAEENDQDEPEQDEDEDEEPALEEGVDYHEDADSDVVDDLIESLFNGSVSMQDMGTLVGVPEGSQVKLLPSDKEDGLWLYVEHPDFDQTCKRVFSRDKEGNLYCKNDIIDIKESAQGSGLGSQIFSDQVRQCRKAGVSYIKCHAARSGSQGPNTFNGYYTWPRMGYDSPLAGGPAARVQEIEQRFPGAQTVLDVMATPEGRDWWKKNGWDLRQAKFDLTPGSRSLRIHEAYLAERAQRRK